MKQRFFSQAILLFIMIPSLILFPAGCKEEASSSNKPENLLDPLPTITFTLGHTEVEVEVAITDQETRQGLMYRESMPENHGMLFIYGQPRYLSFWMKNTLIPLSIAFIRDDGVISNIEKMEPSRGPFDPVERYISRYKCQYALEMNQGWFEQHGIQAGDQIELPLDQINQMIKEKTKS